MAADTQCFSICFLSGMSFESATKCIKPTIYGLCGWLPAQSILRREAMTPSSFENMDVLKENDAYPRWLLSYWHHYMPSYASIMYTWSCYIFSQSCLSMPCTWYSGTTRMFVQNGEWSMSLKRSCEQLYKWSGTTTDLCCILLKSGSTYHYHPLAATWRYKRFGTVAVYCIVAVFQCWFLISKKFFFCVKGENECLTGLWAFSILWTIHPMIRIYMITVNKLSRDMSDRCQYETWHIGIMIRCRVKTCIAAISIMTRDSNIISL